MLVVGLIEPSERQLRQSPVVREFTRNYTHHTHRKPVMLKLLFTRKKASGRSCAISDKTETHHRRPRILRKKKTVFRKHAGKAVLVQSKLGTGRLIYQLKCKKRKSCSLPLSVAVLKATTQANDEPIWRSTTAKKLHNSTNASLQPQQFSAKSLPRSFRTHAH